MMRTILTIAFACGIALPASAATISASDGPYAATAFNSQTFYDFESGTPANFSGGAVVQGTNSSHANPFGFPTDNHYYSVGTDDGSVGTVDLAGLGAINRISLFWGSIDTYNSIDLLDKNDQIIATITGTNVASPPNGSQGNFTENRNVVIDLSASEASQLAFLRFNSTANAFEIDNLAVGSVPEPATWALMIGGFGLVGMAMRRRRRVSVAIA